MDPDCLLLMLGKFTEHADNAMRNAQLQVRVWIFDINSDIRLNIFSITIPSKLEGFAPIPSQTPQELFVDSMLFVLL